MREYSLAEDGILWRGISEDIRGINNGRERCGLSLFYVLI